MYRSDIEQIYPAHADHISYFKDKFINELFEKSEVVAQRKYDGERMLIHFLNGKVWCTSRRISKKTGRYQENQDKISKLPTITNVFGYTVIDCECYADSWSESASILHSLPERAIELQKTINLRFACFDCLFYDGEDIRDEPYEYRLKKLTAILQVIYLINSDRRFHFVEQHVVKSKDEAFKVAEEQWSVGNEGVVIKPLNLRYYDNGAMLKIKRFETVDCVVYGYQEGRGKYEGTVGALLIGYYDPENDRIVHCSKVNCGTDDDRREWKTRFDEARSLNQDVRIVLEVKCQEITDRSLRHPVYVRIRDDKDYHECTKETIFKE